MTLPPQSKEWGAEWGGAGQWMGRVEDGGTAVWRGRV
jgi:hypothetical protein